MNRSYTGAVDDAVAGGLLMTTALLGLIGYFPCFYTILRTPDLRNLFFYRCILSLGIADVLGNIIWFCIGIFIAQHGEGLISQAVADILITIEVVFFMVIPGHLLLMSINRYIGVITPTLLVRYCKPASKSHKWFGLIWFTGLLASSPAFFYPGCSIRLDGYCFGCPSTLASSFFPIFEPVVCVLLVILLCMIYGRIFRELKAHQERVGKCSTLRCSSDWLRYRMVLQVMLVSTLFLLLVFTFYVAPLLSENFWVKFVFAVLFWAFNHAANPWIYFLFNRVLRAQTRWLFRIEDNSVRELRA